MSRVLQALDLLLALLWVQAASWPPAARARLPEVRALCQHAGLACPDQENDLVQPTGALLARLVQLAYPALARSPRGGEIDGALVVLEVELRVAEEQRKEAVRKAVREARQQAWLESLRKVVA